VSTGELPPIVGVVGFKNAGKTTLVERLVAELVGRGLVVRTIKHAHHAVDLDTEGKDSWRHRAAGAASVAVVSAGRWAVLHELRGAEPPSVEAVVRALGPADVVLVEGWKLARHPKIEVRAPGSDAPLLAATDPDVFAVASDEPWPDSPVPVVARDAVPRLADLLASATARR
jgi:molybdopterin-guanine dinucleotide biosynthesis protein B